MEAIMVHKNTYLKFLFRNIVHLLKQNLDEYDIHPVEDKYFHEAIKLFENINNDIKTWETTRTFTSDDLTHRFVIPDLINAYNRRKDFLKELLNNNENYSRVFEFILKILKEFYFNKIKLDAKLKNELIEFFDFLCEMYSDQLPFEKIELISPDSKYIAYNFA